MARALIDGAGAGLLAGTPAARFGSPADVAYAVVFLLSDAASFITGESLHVNGGLYMA